jgi:hypothetical protein
MKLGLISISLASPFLTANPEPSRLIARLKLLTYIAPFSRRRGISRIHPPFLMCFSL